MKKVAIVTGAAKGLGVSIAMALANEGYTLALHFRSSKKQAEKVYKDVLVKSPDSILLSFDLTKEKEVSAMVDDVFREFGRIDLLINNVGNFLYKPFGKTSNSEFRDLLESNIYSTLYCSRAVLEIMRKQKSGQIINIGAVGAERFVFRQNSIPYFLSKNGVYVLTKTIAWEEAQNGIHVNMISPGSMKEDIFKKSDFPMKRSASYNDVVGALLFLISPEAYYINGANIEVSGAFIPGMK